MDKLRALQYFSAAAAANSLSGAARTFGVSAAAVAKSINGLENSLRTRLFDRTMRGLTLTAEGVRYLRACAPALAQISQADELLRESLLRPKGTVVIGVQHVIARGCLTAALPRFHERHPEIDLDVRDFQRVTPEQVRGVDVVLVLGWPKVDSFVLRVLHASRFMVVASPAYWAEHGMPSHPHELNRHVCLPIRAVDGTVMDMWTFTRGEEKAAVAARGWLTTSNAHRDLVIELAIAGHGVIQILDWTNRPELASGALVRVLADWQSSEAIPVNLLYRASVRRIPRVRLFIDFAVEIFREAGLWRGQPLAGSQRPAWLRRHYERASTLMNDPS